MCQARLGLKPFTNCKAKKASASSSSQDALYHAMETIARSLLPEHVLDNPHAAVALVNDVLAGWNNPWLMVFDNLDNPSDLDNILDFFPDGQWLHSNHQPLCWL
jgi:hypothetical protein